MTIKEKYKVIIIGSGFSGICAAINLKKIGIENFVILEKDHAMGGTWYANKYPGAAVDVQSYLYCFSFEPFNWSRKFAFQDEIFQYTNYVIDKYQLREKAKVNTQVVKIEYEDKTGRWLVYTKSGDVFEAEYIFNSFGALVDPAYPTIKGMNDFKGTSFHSARWDTTVDLKGKKVAVVGSAASAVQIIPAIVDKVEHLYVFQRTPHWVMPRHDRELKSWERALLQIRPIGFLYREYLYWRNELRMFAFAKFPQLMKVPQKFALKYIEKKIKSPELRKKVTPNFTFGCKRILLTSDYYPTLERKNVTLEADGIKEITANGIVLPNGQEIKVDVIIWCTGFNVTNFVPFEMIGKNGTNILDTFKDGMHAYLGSLIPGFPKMFLTLGPNTGVGHTSALHIMESQVGLAINIIKQTEKNHWKSIDIKENVERVYNENIQKALEKTVWVLGGCKSWYQDKTGKNRIIYPDFNFKFRLKTRSFDISDYTIEK